MTQTKAKRSVKKIGSDFEQRSVVYLVSDFWKLSAKLHQSEQSCACSVRAAQRACEHQTSAKREKKEKEK